MLHVIENACHLFANDKAAWKKMQIAGMTGDYSWSASAKHYIDVYEQAINY